MDYTKKPEADEALPDRNSGFGQVLRGRGLRFPDFAYHRGTDNHYCAEDVQGSQRLPEQERGEQQRGNGVDIAQDGDGLHAQPVHAAEVQGVGGSRVDDADHQDQGSRGKAEPLCLETAGQEQVRHHGQPGGKQLDGGFPVRVDPRDFLVQDDNERIQHRGAEPEENSGNADFISSAAASFRLSSVSLNPLRI